MANPSPLASNSTTSLDEVHIEHRFRIFPNPLIGTHLPINVNESIHQNETLNCKILKANGQVVFQKKYASLPKVINLNVNWVPGMYSVSMKEAKYNYQEKFIIQ